MKIKILIELLLSKIKIAIITLYQENLCQPTNESQK